MKSKTELGHEIIRGTFNGAELEKLLWETSWVDWKPVEAAYGRFDRRDLSLFDTSPAFHEAVLKLANLLPSKEKNLSAWIERHKEGDWMKVKKNTPGVALMLSLGQFRGGRTFLGDFKGYINPGEILKITVSKNSTPYQVEKVNSGERIVLCLVQKGP